MAISPIIKIKPKININIGYIETILQHQCSLDLLD